jgi:cyclohexadieny/prephenate dehydrogenase
MFKHVTLIGLGLIGSSLAHAVKRRNLAERITGYDISESVRKRAAEIELAAIASDLAEAVKDSDLVILCSPVGSYKELAAAIAPHLKPGAILSDVGSVKSAVIRDVAPALPKGVHFLPAHPIAGTEQSGPDAGFASLFDHAFARRRCWGALEAQAILGSMRQPGRGDGRGASRSGAGDDQPCAASDRLQYRGHCS